MDRPIVETNQNEDSEPAPEPITLDVHDGFIGGTSSFSEGD